jgi:hypothetical protein
MTAAKVIHFPITAKPDIRNPECAALKARLQTSTSSHSNKSLIFSSIEMSFYSVAFLSISLQCDMGKGKSADQFFNRKIFFAFLPDI